MDKAKVTIVESADDVPVTLVTIENGAFSTWAVQAPAQLGTDLFYYTQPDEASARSFYTRLVAHLRKEATHGN